MAEDTKNVKFHEEVQKMEYEPLDATELKLIHWSWALGVFLLMALYFLSDFIASGATAKPSAQGRADGTFYGGFRRVHGVRIRLCAPPSPPMQEYAARNAFPETPPPGRPENPAPSGFSFFCLRDEGNIS